MTRQVKTVAAMLWSVAAVGFLSDLWDRQWASAAFWVGYALVAAWGRAGWLAYVATDAVANEALDLNEEILDAWAATDRARREAEGR